MELDVNGQPPIEFGWHRNLIKSLESLLGICRGLIADNELNEREITFLDVWLKENEEVVKAWPGEVIARRVRVVLADGVVTQEEANDLKETLSQITGEFLKNGLPSGVSTSLPIEEVHSILFDQSNFCFTGKFIYGSRGRCEMATAALGGTCVPSVNKKLNFLVIGGLASRDWKHSSFGTKIQRAAELKDAGHSLRIISEENWAQFV